MLWEVGQAYLSNIFNIMDILLYPVSTIEHCMVGPGENKGFQMTVKRYFDKGLCKYSTNNSLNYTLFQLLYKSNVAFSSSKIT